MNDLDKSISRCQVFSGKMNMMGNSIDLVISPIVEKIGYNLMGKPLGPKIGAFKKNRTRLIPNYSGDFDLLTAKLDRFNVSWNATKHGTMVGSAKHLTFLKNGTIIVFDPKKIAEIKEEFTEIMSGIIEIWNTLKEAK